MPKLFSDQHAARFFVNLAVLLFLLSWSTMPGFAQAPTPEASPATPGTGLILLIPVKGDIDGGLSFFIERMIRRAERENAQALVLEINSNGGLVTAAQEIKDALLKSKVTTIAWVRGRALSAAALIAISCHKIMMEPGSEMGAATPIMLLGPSVQAAEAKFVSAFRGEFEAAAEARKRPKALAGAMVDKDHPEIPNLVKRGEILTMTAETANDHGYNDVITSTLEYGLTRLKFTPSPLERVEPTSGESLARWLTNPNVSVVLFSIGVWALILEFVVFGWGILGWVGLMCLALFFGGHLFAYIAGMEAVLLFVIGLTSLLLELLVLPGFGIAGIIGIVGLSLSFVLAFGGIYSAFYAIGKFCGLSVFFTFVLYHLGPRLKLFDRFILKDTLSTAEGFVAVDVNQYNHLLHAEGITLSPCRPSGIARLGDQRLEVVSEGDFIERKERVTVIAVEGTKIVVRKLNT
jgi:membrane-bound serine protease (ClpP class)